MKKLIVNAETRTIEMSKEFAKAAKIFGSTEYKDLQEARRDNPGFKVVEKKAKRNNAEFSKLDMKAITAYVAAKGTKKQKDEFEELTEKQKDEFGFEMSAASFFEVKSWFLNTFSDLKLEREKRAESIKAIREAAAKKYEEAKKAEEAKKNEDMPRIADNLSPLVQTEAPAATPIAAE